MPTIRIASGSRRVIVEDGGERVAVLRESADGTIRAVDADPAGERSAACALLAKGLCFASDWSSLLERL